MNPDITENEYALIQKIRDMKPREKLVVVKQSPQHRQEYIMHLETLVLFERDA